MGNQYSSIAGTGGSYNNSWVCTAIYGVSIVPVSRPTSFVSVVFCGLSPRVGRVFIGWCIYCRPYSVTFRCVVSTMIGCVIVGFTRTIRIYVQQYIVCICTFGGARVYSSSMPLPMSPLESKDAATTNISVAR